MKFYTNFSQQSSNLLIRGIEDGERIQRKVPLTPYLFTLTNKETGFKTLDGRNVEKKEFDSVWSARDYVKKREGIAGHPIFGSDYYAYSHIYENYPKKIEFDFDLLNVVKLDIEVNSDETTGFPNPLKAEQEITAITMECRGVYYSYGCGIFDPKQFKELDEYDVRYVQCDNERDLIHKYLRKWRELDPDIISGWYVDGFDLPYLYNRFLRLMGEEVANSLSPWNIVESREFTKFGKTQIEYTFVGISVLDYKELYVKHSFTPQESYRLDHIAQYELGVGKLDYSEYDSLAGLYSNNYPKFMCYNILDVARVCGLDDKMKFIELVATMAYDAKVNYQDTYATVKPWDMIITAYLMDQGIVVPQHSRRAQRDIMGGYVKPTVPGRYKWVVSFDAASLYPSVIRYLNIGPDTIYDIVDDVTPLSLLAGIRESLREEMGEKNLTISAIGVRFSKEKLGFLSALMGRMFEERGIYKNTMIEWQQKAELATLAQDKKLCKNNVSKFKNFQQVKKTQLAALYGAIANPGSRWNSPDLAESITATGQVITKSAEIALNSYFNKMMGCTDTDFVIAMDTDSCYLHLDAIVEKFAKPEWDVEQTVTWIDKLCKDVIQPVLVKAFAKVSEKVNAHNPDVIVFKREVIADVAVFVATKRYVLNMRDKEGVRYKTPKMKITGIEAIRSSTPVTIQGYIKECLKIIMAGTQEEMQEYCKKARAEFDQLPFGDIAFPRGCNGIIEYGHNETIWKLKTPIHTRAALIYNHLIVDKKLTNKYTPINEGDKIKFCYLTSPNPIGHNVIGSTNSVLPVEFNIETYLDRETQWQKSFVDPMHKVLESFNWSVEKRASLEAFFG